MRKGFVQMVTAAVIMICSMGLLLYGRSQAEQETKEVALQEGTLQVSSDGGKFYISVYALLDQEKSIRLDAWEQEGRYYLFLPFLFRDQEVRYQDDVLLLEEGSLLLEDEQGNQVEAEVLFGSDIPFACLNTESGDLQYLQESKENKESGTLYLVNADHTLEYAGSLDKVKIRGNATRHQPKLPFRIGLSREASLAGLASSKDYVLLADYGDITLMQNKIAMELANRTTDLYEPSGEHVDLYVNGQYMGVYLLCEGISIGENRLDIADLENETELLNGKALEEYQPFARMLLEDTVAKGYEIPANPEDISGGYLLELEYHGRYETEETSGFRTAKDWSLVIKEPDHASEEQVEYIQSVFQSVENAMYEEGWIDPVTGRSLEELTDLESFVHKYMIDEICMNTDPWTSQFLYKNKGDDKFYFGPMWDYDMAFGHYDTGFAPDEFYCNWHIWYEAVYENPAFQRILKKCWQEQYLPILQELTGTKLEEWKQMLQASARMNFTRWNIAEIYSRNFVVHRGDSFEECVDTLREFIEERTEFLSSEWLENP